MFTGRLPDVHLRVPWSLRTRTTTSEAQGEHGRCAGSGFYRGGPALPDGASRPEAARPRPQGRSVDDPARLAWPPAGLVAGGQAMRRPCTNSARNLTTAEPAARGQGPSPSLATPPGP